MKKLLILSFLFTAAPIILSADEISEPPLSQSDTEKFQGVVTAVDSNGNRPGRSFTAIDSEGKVRMFYIASLQHLDKGDRVILTYKKSEKFPLEVVRIKFLQPETSQL